MKSLFGLTKMFAIVAAMFMLSGAGERAVAKDAYSTLKSDPQFSDFVYSIKSSGLGWTLGHQSDVTIFAPTNEAYAALNKNWRIMFVSPGGGVDQGHGLAMYRIQNRLKGAEIQGKFPEDAFRGKITRVKSVGGGVFYVDGTQPGKLVINPQRPPEEAIGVVALSAKVITAEPPIAADNGIIYPVNGFTVN